MRKPPQGDDTASDLTLLQHPAGRGSKLSGIRSNGLLSSMPSVVEVPEISNGRSSFGGRQSRSVYLNRLSVSRALRISV